LYLGISSNYQAPKMATTYGRLAIYPVINENLEEADKMYQI
jgi:hypothetical protein